MPELSAIDRFRSDDELQATERNVDDLELVALEVLESLERLEICLDVLSQIVLEIFWHLNPPFWSVCSGRAAEPPTRRTNLLLLVEQAVVAGAVLVAFGLTEADHLRAPPPDSRHGR